MKKTALLLILLLGFFLRFNNLNWDDNFHLHPDERFLTMVGNAIKIPASLTDYFNPQKSTLNPANAGYKFFVYGRFPLIVNKILAVNLGLDNYNDFTILGRFLSAFCDLLIVVLVYKITKLFVSKFPNFNEFQRISTIPLWSAFFYAIAVLPIQLSHFFAVDIFLNFFMFASFYFILRFYASRSTFYVLLSSFFFGLALACKITAFYILPVVLFFLFLETKKNWKKTLIFIIYYLLFVYLILRLVDPYLFQSANFFDPRPSQLWIENLKQLKSLEGANIWYPPAVQWIHKPDILFSLVNLAVFGVGIPYFILVIVGMCWTISNLKSQISNLHLKSKNSKTIINNWQLAVILVWLVVFFLYQSSQFSKAMRYFIFIYPFLAIFAAIGAEKVISYSLLVIREKNKYLILNTLYLILIVELLIWPLMFSSIYFHKHTRVEASEWIYANLESGSLVLGEEWDDPLPLLVKNNYGKQFQIEILPVFAPDTKEKWEKMNDLLEKADYYILSSNRGWGSIPTAPEKYPLMSEFYKKLLRSECGKKSQAKLLNQPKRLISGWPKAPCYVKIKEFKPFYYQFFQLPNHWVDESFTVYDHPTVFIYEKIKK